MKKKKLPNVLVYPYTASLGQFPSYEQCLIELYSYDTRMLRFAYGYIDTLGRKVYVHENTPSKFSPSLEILITQELNSCYSVILKLEK